MPTQSEKDWRGAKKVQQCHVKSRNGSAVQNTFGAANNDDDDVDRYTAAALVVNGELQKKQKVWNAVPSENGRGVGIFYIKT